MGPVFDGHVPAPDQFDGMTVETPMMPAGLWGATLAMWPSLIVPPYGLSEGWLWVWTMEAGVRTWRACSVY